MYDQIARFYDLSHADLVEDVALILRLAEQADGPVLELGCGTGRLLWPLAQAGHQVVGVDNSAEMLAIAEQRCQQQPLAVQQRVELVQQDFTKLTLPNVAPFGLALVPYNTFLHLDSGAKRASLRQVRGYLGPNGRLFIDLINPFLLANLPTDDEYILEETLVDPQTQEQIEQFAKTTVFDHEQMVQIDWCYRTEGQETAVVANYHYLYPHELELMLQQCGYQVVVFWGDYDQAAFTQENGRLLILAKPK